VPVLVPVPPVVARSGHPATTGPVVAAESPLPNAAIVQDLLVPVTQQLGMIQHQMFEQFQQAMMMMFQMFGKLQQEQLGVIRDEMEHLRELSKEVLILQKELAKHPQGAPNRPRSTGPAPGPRAASAAGPHKPVSPPAPDGKERAPEKPLPLPHGQPAKDMHAWLIERLATLQEERQTRWQRIMSFLTGKANEE
jgi:hypothetical protein